MNKTGEMTQACEPIRWKARAGMRFANGLIEIVVLEHGGHIASLRFTSGNGENLMWEAPWKTLDAVEEWSQDLIDAYGPAEVGRYLAGYTGHVLCLDYFGPPSPAGAAAGRSLHGEAAVMPWRIDPVEMSNGMRLRCTVELSHAGLRFERTIRLGPGESVIYVEESVSNLRSVTHVCDWMQHVTFGPPFLSDSECTVEVSANRGITSADQYDNGSLLKAATEFEWPMAPHEDRLASVDLRRPFSTVGRGFLAGLQLETKRKQQFLTAINWKLHLGIAYCFRRSDFPWMTVWEENGARTASPWNARTVARGMEFGTSPLPFGEQDGDTRRSVLGLSTGCEIPANSSKSARYMIVLFHVPEHVKSVGTVEVVADQVILYDKDGGQSFSVAAAGGESFLCGEETSVERAR